MNAHLVSFEKRFSGDIKASSLHHSLKCQASPTPPLSQKHDFACRLVEQFTQLLSVTCRCLAAVALHPNKYIHYAHFPSNVLQYMHFKKDENICRRS